MMPAPDSGAAPSSPRLRWALFAVVVVTSIVAIVGAFNPAPHAGGDNAGYVALAYGLLTEGRYVELFDPAGNAHTKYPPLFPLVLAGAMWAGVRTWVGLKLVAALSTVVAVVASYAWAERRLGSVAAAGVAAALALSSAVVYYSHWILSDPTFLAFTMAGLWALERADDEDAGPGWLAFGVAVTVAAYFTRSAGLPLMVALLGWLALARRGRALLASTAALGAPALLWWLRARGVRDAQAQYASEFWMVDPYQPELGTVGFGGLVARAASNLSAYVGGHIPGGIVGGRGGAVVALGVALAIAGTLGWALALRRRRGPAELFFPLYAGLLLVWPEVWSGDRFALPLYPLLFVYAGGALLDGARRLGAGVPRLAGAVALLVLLLPALRHWTGEVESARACARLAEARGPFACYGPRYEQFAEAAAWSAANLPAGSAVLTRKPRIFYVLSGLPSRTFPFDPDAGAHLAMADALQARHVLLDQIDNLATRYVGGALQAAPGAFCSVRGFGQGAGLGTQLLGVLGADRRSLETAPAGSIRIVVCPPDFTRGAEVAPSYASSGRIPLLDGLAP